MTIILLAIIYLSFISLGLPDTIIGVTIPSLQNDFNISLATGGILSMVLIGGTVLSSFLSDKIIKKIGTGKVVALSCLLTGSSLLLFSLSPSFIFLVLLAFPLGFGGGTVDVALNNYVAHNFKAHHMNWLHSFWGLGATLGPIIMSWNLKNSTWRGGFGTISTLQLGLALLLFLSLPVWTHHSKKIPSEHHNAPKNNVFKINGVPFALVTMLLYCATEIGTGLWGSSFLISVKGFTPTIAARFIAFYYFGITIGRLLSGFVSFKLNNNQLIKLGLSIATCGIILIVLPLPNIIIGTGVILTGLGLAPIFPSMIHETPNRFPKELSQRIIGFQMGFAYIGSAIVPPILGVIYQTINLSLFPYAQLLLLALLFVVTHKLAKIKTS